MTSLPGRIPCGNVLAMSRRAFVPEDLPKVKVPSDPQISPDELAVVYAVKRVADKNRYASDLYIWSQAGLRQITFGDSIDSAPRWSPDGTSVAFTSDRLKPKPGLFLLSMSGGEPSRIVDLPEGSLGKYEWSPDGKFMAFAFREKSAERTDGAKSERKENGLSEPPLIVETLVWRMDGDGVFGDDRYKIYVVHVESGEHRLVFDKAADGEYSFCWTDFEHLAIAHNPSSNPTMEPYEDVITVVGLDGSEHQIRNLPLGQKTSLVRVKDDQICLSYNDRTQDKFGYKAGRLCFLNISDGIWQDPYQDDVEFDMNASTLSDTKDAGFSARMHTNKGRVYGEISKCGSTHVYEFSMSANATPLTQGNGEWCLGSVSGSMTALVNMTPTSLPEIVVSKDGRELYRSAHNAEIYEEIYFIEGAEMWVDSTDGSRIQTWVLKPAGYTDGANYPACLEVHGGPHAMYSCAVFLEMQVLAGAGYVVCWSNPRGSTGYGEQFARDITGDWGNKDWTDVQAVTNYLRSLEFVDKNRIAIMGGSYGGYMVNWAIGHTNEYKCAITDRCVSNLLSKSGNSDYTFVPNGNWPGSAFSGDWEVLWDRSPVKHFANVDTPTLVVHSEGDLRCHVEQGEQVYTFLKMKGVPTRLVRYPANTSHGMSRSGPPDMRIHRLREQLSWYEKYL